MNNDELISKLKTIVKPYIQDEAAFEALSEATNFIDDLKINSANLVDVVLDVEDAFDIRIENEDMEKMTSVKAAMDIVNEKLASKMIGNDIVDLKRITANWKRPRFLDKTFTLGEQVYIQNSKNKHQMVWLLWSMKEAAYKAYVKQYQDQFFLIRNDWNVSSFPK